MPGVSGEENVQGEPTRGGLAKLPGLVPAAGSDGLLPTGGWGGCVVVMPLSPVLRPRLVGERPMDDDASLRSWSGTAVAAPDVD